MLKIIEKFNSDKDTFALGFINFYGESNSKYIINKDQNANIIWHDGRTLEENEDMLSHIITDLSR